MVISRIWRKYKSLSNVFMFTVLILVYLLTYIHSVLTKSPVVLCKNDDKVVINLRSGFDFLNRFPKAFACKTKFNNSWTEPSMSSSNDTNYDYSKPAPKHSHKIRITRAIAIQFPIKATKHYLIEFKSTSISYIEFRPLLC